MAFVLLMPANSFGDDRIFIEDGDEVSIERVFDQRPPVGFVKRKGRCGSPHMGCVPMHKDHGN
mgnify:CR=1 FL=1